ncbi:bestrophin-like domain [Jannaschia ovalis]|uniref:DUF4239 domain-containing protein n=1 Tax=Jannaschia ovalis TaxID=3038773 RepID=A0ABY8LB37_9RHOB|nr:hypothetical protein [Jannaschia sp. GRR-S6-38]WGH77255.1 hypothetical protein P8627_09330 [Jannaschia sp. GRR-S6-38]
MTADLLPTLALAAGFVAAAVALVLATYSVTRRFGARGLSGDGAGEARDLSGSVMFRISALHGLILALVFAQLLGDYREIQGELVVEASAVADLYNDFARHGGAGTAARQALMVDYARTVAEVEWPALGEGYAPGGRGWAVWGAAYEAVLDLPAATPREVALRVHMLEAAHRIAEMRDRRAVHGLHGLAGLFWIAAVAGTVLIAATWFTFPPRRRNLMLMACFGAFTGLILFFIHAFSNPFAAPGALQPVAMERFLAAVAG